MFAAFPELDVGAEAFEGIKGNHLHGVKSLVIPTSMNTREPLWWSQAWWAKSDFNKNQSTSQCKWRRQHRFFTSCSFSKGAWVMLCLQRHLPSPIRAAAAAYCFSEMQPRPRESRNPFWEGEQESWNYSSWILARNTRVKNQTLLEGCWDLTWWSRAGCLFSISSNGRHIQL